MKTDSCRFCRLYALALAPIAALLATLVCWQISVTAALVLGATIESHDLASGEALARGGYQLATVEVLSSVLRSVAPATTGSALLIALVAWAHPLSDGAFKSELGWVLKRGAIVTPAGYVAAALVGGVVARLLGFGISGSYLPRDLCWGLIASGIDSALVTFVAWRFLGVLRATKLSLAGALVVACTAVLPLRAVVGLILESVLPG